MEHIKKHLSKQASPILVTRVVGSTVHQHKSSASLSRQSDEKEKKRKKNLEWQLQSFLRYTGTQ